MTNRVNGLFIALDKDYRDDDVKVIINAIKMIRGVASVEQNIVDAQDYFNRSQLAHELRNDIIDFVIEKFDAKK